MYCEGFSLRAISRAVKVSHTQVKKYIDPLLKEWQEDRKAELEEIKKRRLLKLDHWDKRVARAFNQDPPLSDVQLERVAREIHLRLQIDKHEARLLGLEKKVQDNLNWDMSQFTDDELAEIAAGAAPELIIKRRNEFSANTGEGSSRIKKA